MSRTNESPRHEVMGRGTATRSGVVEGPTNGSERPLRHRFAMPLPHCFATERFA
jgi:hypothetical protein